MERILTYLDIEKSFDEDSIGYKKKKLILDFPMGDSDCLTELWDIGYEIHKLWVKETDEIFNRKSELEYISQIESFLGEFEQIFIENPQVLLKNSNGKSACYSEFVDGHGVLFRLKVVIDLYENLGRFQNDKNDNLLHMEYIYPIYIFELIERVCLSELMNLSESVVGEMIELFKYLTICRNRKVAQARVKKRHSSTAKEKALIWKLYKEKNYTGFSHAANVLANKEQITLSVDTIKRFLSKESKKIKINF